jgi:Leucine-rich repeat (LRR) protein
MTHRLSYSLIYLTFALLTACGSYDFTINDRVVYRPGPLFEDFEVADQALRHCLEQAIASNTISAASQLSSLDCSNAGVSSLAGLSTFTEIEQLWLSHNTITDLAELQALTVLQQLYLDHNQVVDPVPLYDLPALSVVDLSGNPGLRCPDSTGLLRAETVVLPRHCR